MITAARHNLSPPQRHNNSYSEADSDPEDPKAGGEWRESGERWKEEEEEGERHHDKIKTAHADAVTRSCQPAIGYTREQAEVIL